MNKSYVIAEVNHLVQKQMNFLAKDPLRDIHPIEETIRQLVERSMDDLETIFKIYLNVDQQRAEQASEIETLKAENIILNEKVLSSNTCTEIIKAKNEELFWFKAQIESIIDKALE